MKKAAIIISFFFAAVSSATVSHQALLRGYDKVFDIEDYSGQTYLSFMRQVIKPAIDDLAIDGYEVADSDTISAVYGIVDAKVKGVVDKNGGLEKVGSIADRLAGKTVTHKTLPAEIAKIDRSVDRYDVANFFGLASGGGVVIRYFDDNFAFNVHYDSREQKSGRSFGAGPTRGANDASDKAYLNDLEEFVRGEDANTLPEFNRALLESLLNSDASNYSEVAPFGQTVLTDFLAVYTAEQARNLMDGRIDIHWDAALLEVTLLASFHAGQEKIKLYYANPETGEVSFTDKVLNQTPCDLPDRMRAAHLRDYWQFSRRIHDEKNCRRSGINITKREFRKLERRITKYMYENYPKLATAVERSMHLNGRSANLFLALSELLINSQTPDALGARAYKIADAWVEFLSEVTSSAEDITTDIELRP